MSKENYSTGATRNKLEVRHDLLVRDFIREMGVVMYEGCLSHGPDNWKAGMPIGTVLNHLYEHLAKWEAGDRSEPHLAKVAVNAMFIQYYVDNKIDIKEAVQ